jgi:hypothetical protein
MSFKIKSRPEVKAVLRGVAMTLDWPAPPYCVSDISPNVKMQAATPASDRLPRLQGCTPIGVCLQHL